MINIHIYPSDFKNESRIEKQAESLNRGLFDHIYLIGMGADETKIINNGITLKLFGLANRSGTLHKLLRFIFFYFKVLFFCIGKKNLVVNSHSLSVLPLAYILKVFKGAALIYDTHELETETNSSKGVRSKIAKIVERSLIKKADHVFVVSESIADWYENNYKIERPTVVLNSPKYIDVPRQDYFRRVFGIRNNQIIVLYQGVLASGRGIDFLLETFKSRVDDNFVIVFMGYGDYEKTIKKESESNSNIFFHHAVPPSEILNYTASADIGVSFIQNTCLSYYYCMPNKLFEYTMAGLPVIVSNMMEMKNFVEKYKIGFVVTEESSKSLNCILDSILLLDLNFFKEFARRASFENSWEHQEKKMLSVYEKVLKCNFLC